LEEKDKEEADKEEDEKTGISGVSNMSFLSPAIKYSPNSGVKNLLSPII
jgi:hypothetical protein